MHSTDCGVVGPWFHWAPPSIEPPRRKTSFSRQWRLLNRNLLATTIIKQGSEHDDLGCMYWMSKSCRTTRPRYTRLWTRGRNTQQVWQWNVHHAPLAWSFWSSFPCENKGGHNYIVNVSLSRLIATICVSSVRTSIFKANFPQSCLLSFPSLPPILRARRQRHLT